MAVDSTNLMAPYGKSFNKIQQGREGFVRGTRFDPFLRRVYPSEPTNPFRVIFRNITRFMSEVSYYETEQAASEYLLLHYGAPVEVLPYSYGPSTSLNYPVRCVIECLDKGLLPPKARGLDLGCSVGRSSFELARTCHQVIGIDASKRFIEIANTLKEKGALTYRRKDEGELFTELVARLPRGIDPDRVTFRPGDAMNLPGDLGQFDVVLGANLIDRLADPRKFLQALPGLLRPGGQLILSSPYTWSQNYTPRKNWLGGLQREGAGKTTLRGLIEELSENFVLVRELDLPFLIREHARKFQWSVAQATIWIRKGRY